MIEVNSRIVREDGYRQLVDLKHSNRSEQLAMTGRDCGWSGEFFACAFDVGICSLQLLHI